MASCSGKTALVTDASDAQGVAAATALASAGARVLIHDRHSAAKIEALVRAILSAGGVAGAVAVDTLTAQGQQQLARQTRKIVGDRLDILVLNVDCSEGSAPSDDAGATFAFEESVASPESAPFLLIQLLLPILNQGSSVIFMYLTSGAPSSAASASRSLQETIARQARRLAEALKPRGVRVNVIEIGRARTSSRYVGSAITFLASNESSEITGTTMRAHIPTSAGLPPAQC